MLLLRAICQPRLAASPLLLRPPAHLHPPRPRPLPEAGSHRAEGWCYGDRFYFSLHEVKLQGGLLTVLLEVILSFRKNKNHFISNTAADPTGFLESCQVFVVVS